MNGLHTRNALHEYTTTPRTRKEAGITGPIDNDAPTGAALVWAAGCLLAAVVALLVWVAV